MRIREAKPEDARGVSAIYNYYVENTTVTFETVAVTEEEMRRRIGSVLAQGCPFFVGEIDGEIAGYCYLHTWNSRSAYDTTKEITIYLDKDRKAKGLGTLLYRHLFSEIGESGLHALIAGICIPNEASVRLHEKFGFRQVSCMKEIGRKFGEWCDVGHWLLILDGDGK